jgi:WD40 repeat protein/tetratricopeptide (TPR) repeat protein
MKVEHSTLLRRRRTGFLNSLDTLKQEIETFLARGRVTGTLLGDDDERYEAQNLLTYWSNILYRLAAQRTNDVLAKFDWSRSPRLADEDNPYLRLDHLPEEGLSRSPGWQRLINEAIRAVTENRVTTIVGAAGGGRTVLVHDCLLPALRGDRLLPGSAKWEYLPPFMPGKDPLADLARALSPSSSKKEIDNQAAQLLRDPAGQVRRLVADRTRPVVVVVERLEEVLVQAEAARVRSFADALLALIDVAEPGPRVILASDPGGLARLKTFGPFGRRLLQGQVLVTFTAAELRQMVLEPAKRVGLHFDDGLIDRLLLDVQGDPAALALLQFTLQRLWDARTGNRITHEAYDRIGGGRLAVSRCAEEFYTALDPDQQEAAKRILLRLIRPVFGVGVSCQRVPLDKLLAEAERQRPSPQLLEKLVEAGLIVRIDATPAVPEFAPVHESLATAWPRFLGWLEETRERQQWRLRLRAAAEQWRAEGNKSGALWSGAVLELALEEARRLRSTGDCLDDLEQDFLDESESRDRFRRKLWWAGLALALASGVAIAVLSVLYYRASAADADARRKLSDDAKKLATLQTASLQLDEGARRARDLDTSAAFLWYAQAWTNFQSSSDVLEDDTKKERLEASYLLLLGAARQQLPVLVGMAYHPELLASDRTPDGKVLLTVGADDAGTIHPPAVRLWHWSEDRGPAAWNPSTLQWGKNPPGQEWTVAGGYLSPNGQFVVLIAYHKEAGGEARANLYVWDISGSEKDPPKELKGYEGLPSDAGFSPDGQFFAAVTLLNNQSKVTVWQVKDWDTPLKLAETTTPDLLGRLAFSPAPSSPRLAVAIGSTRAEPSEDSAICLEWSLREPQVGLPPRHYVRSQIDWASSALQPGEPITFVTYKPDGSRLLVARSFQNSPRAAAWLFEVKEDVKSDVRVPPLQTLSPPHRGAILHAMFSPTSRDHRFLTAGTDGTVALWSAFSSSGPKGENYHWVHIFKHKAQVFKTDFSPDGLYILTASRDRSAMIWHADSGQPAHPSLQHTGSVTEASFLDDGRHVITGSEKAIYRWDLTQRESRPLPLSATPGVRTISADPNGLLVVTGGERTGRLEQNGPAGWARVWDAATGDPRSPELPHPSPVRHAVLSGSGRSLVSTVTTEGEVRLWEAGTGNLLWSDKPAGAQAIFTAFGKADGGIHLLVLLREATQSLSGQSSLKMYLLGPDGKPVGEAREMRYPAFFTAAALSPGCKYAVAYAGDEGGDPGVAVVWDVQSPQPTVLRGFGKRNEHAHDEAITHAAFTRSGDRLVTTSRDDTAVVWNLPAGTGQRLANRPGEAIAGHTADIMFASFDQSGDRVVTAGADGAAIVWQVARDLPNGQPVRRLENEGQLTHALFSADERYILTVGLDGTARYWDAEDGRRIASRDHPGRITQIVCRENAERDARVLLLGSHIGGGAPYRGRMGPQQVPRGVDAWDWPVRPFAATWHLSPAAPLGDSEHNMARATAGRQLTSHDDLTRLTLLPQDKVFELWTKHRSRPDVTKKQPGSDRAGWHEREAAVCELAQRWHEALRHWELALKDLPANDRQWVLLARRARVHGELEDWSNAEKDCSKALDGASPNAELVRARAQARFRLSMTLNFKDKSTKLQTAISDYKLSLQLEPTDNLTRARLGDAYYESGQYQEAVAQYDQAIQHDTHNPDLLLKRAIAHSKEPNRQLAKAYKDYLDSARLFKARRRPDQALKAYSGAVGMLDQGVDQPPAVRAQLHAELADVQAERAELVQGDERKKRYQDACKHYERATELDDSIERYWRGLAHCHDRLGEWEKIVAALDKAAKQIRDDVQLLISRAEALSQLGRWEQAAQAYENAIKLERQVLRHRLELAAIHLQPLRPDRRPEQFEAADRCLADATKDFPNDSIVWVYRALVQLASGRVEAYQATRARMLELFRTAGPAEANNAAWAAAFAEVASEDGARVIELAEKAYSAAPQNADYLNTLGAVLYRAGKSEEAVLKLHEATDQRRRAFVSPDKLAAGNAFDLLFQAMAEYALGQVDQARETLEKADTEIKRFNGNDQPETPSQSLSRVWDRLQLQILRAEADKLINKR